MIALVSIVTRKQDCVLLIQGTQAGHLGVNGDGVVGPVVVEKGIGRDYALPPLRMERIESHAHSVKEMAVRLRSVILGNALNGRNGHLGQNVQ